MFNESNDMQEISWERLTNGKRAQLYSNSEYAFLPVAALLVVRPEQMRDVIILSAHFQGKQVVFVHQFGIYLESHTHAEYLGVYEADARNDDEEEGIKTAFPSFCLRKVYWEKPTDLRTLRQVKNMRLHLLQSDSIESRITFFPASRCLTVKQLLEKSDGLVREGTTLIAVERLDLPWTDILIELRHGLDFTLGYRLDREENATWESLVEEWQHCFTDLEHAEEIVPDGNCLISYAYSVNERMKSLPEQGFEAYQKEKQARNRLRLSVSQKPNIDLET